MTQSKNVLSRRAFLRAGCAGAGALTYLSTLSSLGMTSALASGNDYKALVCILLNGGWDSYNVLLPTDSARYAEYSTVRSTLALSGSEILPLTLAEPDGSGGTYGMHATAAPMQQLFNQGKLSFVANTGTMVDGITSAAQAANSKLPLGLYSHSDQAAQWQTGVPGDRRIGTGFCGRMADALSGLNTRQDVSMNITLGGTNILQTGSRETSLAIQRNGRAAVLDGYGGTDALAQLTKEAVDGQLAEDYQNVLARSVATTTRNVIDTNAFVDQALQSGGGTTAPFSTTPIAQDLKAVATVIAARSQLGQCRQTFFVRFGGWDHHFGLKEGLVNRLGQLAPALAEFQAALEALGVADRVTTFSISDFGRTLSSNGQGSDHGWGGNAFVMGGAVRGGRVLGTYPTLALGTSLDLGRGRLVPTTPQDRYFGDIARWFGVSAGDMDAVLPAHRNFDTTSLGLFV